MGLYKDSFCRGKCGLAVRITLAHHLTIDSGKRHLIIAALRYYDTFAKIVGAWRFAERLLYVDWLEERPLS
jgi:hypothetical protein